MHDCKCADRAFVGLRCLQVSSQLAAAQQELSELYSQYAHLQASGAGAADAAAEQPDLGDLPCRYVQLQQEHQQLQQQLADAHSQLHAATAARSPSMPATDQELPPHLGDDMLVDGAAFPIAAPAMPVAAPALGDAGLLADEDAQQLRGRVRLLEEQAAALEAEMSEVQAAANMAVVEKGVLERKMAHRCALARRCTCVLPSHEQTGSGAWEQLAGFESAPATPCVRPPGICPSRNNGGAACSSNVSPPSLHLLVRPAQGAGARDCQHHPAGPAG